MTAPGLPANFTATGMVSGGFFFLYNDGWKNPNVENLEDFPSFVSFSWTAAETFKGSSDFAGAQFQMATNPSMTSGIRTLTTPRIVSELFQYGGLYTSGIFGNVTADAIYYARMRVRNGNFLQQEGFLQLWTENTSAGSYGPWTPVVPVKVGSVPPVPPTTVTVNSFFAGSALLGFTPATQQPGVLPVTSFFVEYSLDDTFATGVQTLSLSPEVNNHLFTGLQQGQTYYFRVSAVNDDGVGNPSAVQTVTIEAAAFPEEAKIVSPGTYGPGFYSLAGHVAGFGVDGKFLRGIETDLDYEVRLHTPTTNKYNIIGNQIYAKNVTTDTLYFVPNPSNPSLSSLNAIRFKTVLQEQNCVVSWSGQPAFPSLYGGKNFNITINYDAETLTATSNYSDNGNPAQETNTVSLAGLNLDVELAVTIQYQRVTLTDPVTGVGSFEYDLLASVCPVTDYSNPVSVLLDYETDSRDAVTQRVQIQGNIRSLCVANNHRVLGAQQVFEYELPPEYTIDGDFSLSGPVPSLITNVWEYVQDGAAASLAEVNVVDNKPTARNVGSRVIDITNVSPQPTITPTTAFSGQAINVTYNNANIVTQGLIYYSFEDNNRIFTVNFNEEITTTVSVPGSPSFVQQPIIVPSSQYLQYIQADSFPFSVYNVIDATGIPIVPQQWLDFEGFLEVTINTEIPNAIDVRFKGPREEIPATTAPYRLAFSAGAGADVGALALIGSGVLFNKESVEILTGAPTDRVTKITATNIDNPFVNTLEQAYDLGATAADIAAGPNVTLTGTIPVSAIEGFGLVAGSLIQYRDNIYRVSDATIGNLAVGFTATEYVTVGQFDAQWGDINVSVHDALWGDNQAQDQKIFPFREVGYPDSIVFDINDYLPPDPDFFVVNSGVGAYLINDVSNDTITVVRGESYVFDIDASGHPFWIQTVSGGYSPGNIYGDGITGNGTQVGTLTWTVSSSAPNTLYYACQFHTSMQGAINVID